jgi:hypothetical protein
LIYCYATGTFSSRRIETLTHENVAVRYLCANTHPDHDSICKFRRENKDLLSDAFHQVLELAARARVLQVWMGSGWGQSSRIHTSTLGRLLISYEIRNLTSSLFRWIATLSSGFRSAIIVVSALASGSSPD